MINFKKYNLEKSFLRQNAQIENLKLKVPQRSIDWATPMLVTDVGDRIYNNKYIGDKFENYWWQNKPFCHKALSLLPSSKNIQNVTSTNTLSPISTNCRTRHEKDLTSYGICLLYLLNGGGNFPKQKFFQISK